MTDITLAAEAWEGVDAAVEALVDKWLVQAGDTVRAGQPLANVVLVKSSQEITAPADGRIAQILVPAGGTFARGKPVATLA
ncbi:lipoyl domain-containing protein [Curvibacter sp. PAE-UM]|uniref:lipoyl domain-containing protein n=1 Tax=Curvibacter sp. PAE-UM TaxID=1714344 RepID=UPI00070BE923|nr:lipoyl domain-containing protein [Curvibacter sp. PAE-UM]KRI00695.1 biotin attachment protein [Curvibacter sp. PAE-UM]